MASYVIGDVQGCFTTLERLLARIGFDASQDRLWFVGDLVNRGPSSLAVLRWVRGLGDRAVVVLGNHDLHLIDRARGRRSPKTGDTFDDVLRAPDRDELIDWLAARPLLHREGDLVLVHAGILPTWTLDEAEARARRAEAAVRDDRPSEATRTVLAALTRIRTCRENGELCLDFTGPPAEAPPGCRPWFERARIPFGVTVLFGHWASLGLHIGEHVIGLDTGCVWGGQLTALRLEGRVVFQERSELAL